MLDAVRDQRRPALAALDRSGAPRGYWTGVAPDEPGERWYFETVAARGAWVAVRQLSVRADGSARRYSLDHLEDEDGFLTDQPIQPDEWGLRVISREEWQAAWASP